MISTSLIFSFRYFSDRKILLSIADLKADVRNLTKIVLALHRSQGQRNKEGEQAPQPLPEDVSLPLRTTAQLEDLEQHLGEDQSLRNSLVCMKCAFHDTHKELLVFSLLKKQSPFALGLERVRPGESNLQPQR